MVALNKLYDWYDIITQDLLGLKKEHTKYVKPVGLSLLAGLLAFGGWYLYSQRTTQSEHESFKIFNDCMREYERAIEGKAEWKDVDAMCSNGYQRNASSAVAPYILAIRIDALLAQQKQQEALEQSTIMLAHLPANSPLYAPYKTKHSLLEIDSSDEATRLHGLRELEKLANDTKNIYNDVALYYLGLYYFMHADLVQAKEIWNRLVLQAMPADKQGQSPWAARAKEKLQYL